MSSSKSPELNRMLFYHIWFFFPGNSSSLLEFHITNNLLSIVACSHAHSVSAQFSAPQPCQPLALIVTITCLTVVQTYNMLYSVFMCFYARSFSTDFGRPFETNFIFIFPDLLPYWHFFLSFFPFSALQPADYFQF